MSLTVRLGLTYLLLTLAGVLLVGTGFVALAGRYLASERERELSAQTEIYAALLGELAATPAQLQAIAQGLPGGELLPAGTAARLFSTTGTLVVGDPELGPFPSRPALALMKPAIPLPASQVAGRQYAARTIAGPVSAIGVVELSRETVEDERLLRDLSAIVLQAAVAAAVLMGTLSALVARGLARPIVRLTEQAARLAATYTPPGVAAKTGPLRRRPLGADEIAALERSLARLDAGLQAYVARIDELEQTRASFYRGVSHELRTPLTAIRGALENMADRAPPELRQRLTTLEGEAARLSRLVDELLRPPEDARLTLGARVPIELAALGAEVVALLSGRARRAGVTLRATGTGGRALGDHDRLKQALLNLADNALRVTPPGGTVTLHAETAGQLARVAVEDGGPGVAAELRGRIWERGVRGGDPATDGSAGLGLAIVSDIAAAHGGRAYLDEAWGPGARFVIELPAEEVDGG